MERRIFINRRRRKRHEIIRQRDRQLRNLQTIPRRALQISTSSHQRSIAPDLDFGEGEEGAEAHVAEPGRCDDLPAEADLAARGGRVVDDCEADEGEFGVERVDAFGPDDG